MPSTQRQPLEACTRCASGVATGQPYVAIPWQREWLALNSACWLPGGGAGARLGK